MPIFPHLELLKRLYSCSIFLVIQNKPKSYEIFLGPDGKVKLNVSLTLESILDLDEVKSLMKLQIEIKLSWVDSRLEFVNVDQEMNSINLKQKEMLWLPSLIFDNTNDKIEASFNDDISNGIIDVQENARGHIAPLMELQNFKKYTGSQGYVLTMVALLYFDTMPKC